MTFEQIGYFLALAEEGSFVRAARRCAISQPSLSNAIRALEAALGAPLFERTVTGSELTAFGRGMLPILARIHDDRTRALEFAHSFDCSSNGKAVARSGLPRLQSWPERAGRLAKSGRRTGTLALAVLLACAAIAIGGSASAGENGVEAAIREMLPAPFRCSRTTEPALYCRHDTAADRTMVLELVSGSDGPSASLTHDYDDARRHEFFATMRGFFVRLGVSADAFDECISQSQWQPAHQSGIGHRVLCYRIELGDRVTHEVFVQAADEVPKLADAGEAAR
jgi:DNA-binding transcriptional LysR family regulator